MSILFVGGEPEDFPEGAVTISTGSGIRAQFSRCSLTPSDHFGPGSILPETPFWIGFRGTANVHNAYSTTGFRLYGADGVNYIGLYQTADTGVVKLVSYNGAATVTLATGLQTFPYGGTPPASKFDFRVTPGASGGFQLYYESQLYLNYSGDMRVPGLGTPLTKFLFWSGYSGYSYISEMIVATDDTRTLVVKTLVPNANGDVNEWTGDYTFVDEVSLDTGDVLYSPTAGQKILMNLSGMPSGQFVPKAVQLSCVASKADAGGPTGVQIGVKSGGVENFGPTQVADNGWGKYKRLMYDNPTTGNRFSTAEIEALQVGILSVA